MTAHKEFSNVQIKHTKKINKLSIIFCVEILLPKTDYENILGKKYDYLVENAYENKVLFGARRGKC